MSLRIQNNIDAFNAHRQLVATGDRLSKSMERLSSGYRINRAADDSAGLAISEKLRAQATGLDVDAALHEAALTAHLEAWTPHTVADPAAVPLLTTLRERGIRTGLLSNTHWPREWHEQWLMRDGLLDLLDARVYTSDLDHVKPHPQAFRTLLARVDVAPGEAVFVGDRLHDDIGGAAALGMRTVWIRNDAVPRADVTPDAVIDELSELVAVVDAWSDAQAQAG